jgi:hypothetical protein
VRFALDPNTHPLCREIMWVAPDKYAAQLHAFNYRERRGAMVLFFSEEAGRALHEASSTPSRVSDSSTLDLSDDSCRRDRSATTGVVMTAAAAESSSLLVRVQQFIIKKTSRVRNDCSAPVRLPPEPPIECKYQGPLIWYLLRTHGDTALIRSIVTML